jgi:hypothetical protein
MSDRHGIAVEILARKTHPSEKRLWLQDMIEYSRVGKQKNWLRDR